VGSSWLRGQDLNLHYQTDYLESRWPPPFTTLRLLSALMGGEYTDSSHPAKGSIA